MARQVLGAALRSYQRAAGGAGQTDQELLTRFNAGDQAAFAALVERHTGLVLGVCRRVLPTIQDAEDACQATFLVLSQKAARGRWGPSIANWLYCTARHIALKSNRAAQRRAKREARAVAPPAPSVLDQMTGREAFAALDEELDRLPAWYREPLVLCHLQGLTRDEAGARLGVPLNTLKSRLERGRKKLADALTQRGIALGAGLLAAAVTSPVCASPPRLVEAILATLGGTPSPTVAALAQGATVNGILTKTKMAALALVGVVAVGLGLVSAPTAAEAPPESRQAARTEPVATPPHAEEIVGRVVGPDGKPVAAELFLLPRLGQPLALGQARDDGTFRVQLPPGGRASSLVARAAGLGADFVHTGSLAGPVTLRLVRDVPIRGRVVDTQGQPVAGALVFPRQLDDFGPTLDRFLDHWRTRNPQGGLLGGMKDLHFEPRSTFTLPDGRLILAARTGPNGDFVLSGIGAERLVRLMVRGPGTADAEVLVVNRTGFDPAPLNREAADNRERQMPRGLRPGSHELTLHGPRVTIVAEPEKRLRGVVRDRDTGKPRAGVEVAFGRIGDRALTHHVHAATTDAAGRFEIRGSRKYEGYVLEVAGDADTGYLPSQVAASDTPGYDPIDVDLPCVKGLLLTGRVTDRATGKPLAGIVTVEPMRENPYLVKYPVMYRSRRGPQQCVTGENGSYHMAIPPGPVLVMVGLQRTGDEVRYQPARPDPKYPQYFHERWGTLAYVTATGAETTVRGCWCKVVQGAETDRTVALDVALEPAPAKETRVVDPEGKPAVCDAAGLLPRDLYPLPQEAGVIRVYGLGADEERRVVACDQQRRLVGSTVARQSDREPVLRLGPSAVVEGRAVDTDGKPLAGLRVHLYHPLSAAQGIFELLSQNRTVETATDGTFRVEGVVPGHEFRLAFSRGSKNLGVMSGQGPHVVAEPGGKKSVGDVRVKGVP